MAAAEAVSPEAATTVRDAWEQVGVTASSGGPQAPAPSTAPSRVAVTRTGGFAGVRQSGELVLGEDPRTSEVESLLGRIDVRSLAPHRPQPDRFVYSFDLAGDRVTVGEQDLTDDLRQLVTLLLPR